jgi:ATP synthase protein I
MESGFIRRLVSFSMSEKSEIREHETYGFSREIGIKVARKLKARRNSANEVWFGLGMMGLIGWSVVVPTLLGAALGSGWTAAI